jgi:hypothetical protein
MRTTKIKYEKEIEFGASGVGIHFEKDGIIAMVEMDYSDYANNNEKDDKEFETEDFKFTWLELYSWAQASGVNEDGEGGASVVKSLRKMADDLEDFYGC